MRIGIRHSVLTITTEFNLIWPCFQSQFLHKHCYYLLFFLNHAFLFAPLTKLIYLNIMHLLPENY